MYSPTVVLDYGNKVKVIIQGGEYYLEARTTFGKVERYEYDAIRRCPFDGPIWGQFIEEFEHKMATTHSRLSEFITQLSKPLRWRRARETVYFRDDDFREEVRRIVDVYTRALMVATARERRHAAREEYRRCPTPPP